jgi:hypothetical protein
VAVAVPAQLTVTALRIARPDSLVVTRQDVIEVHLAGAAEASDYGSWSIVVRRDTTRAPVIQLGAFAPPGPALRMPVSILPPDLSAGYLEVHGGATHAFASVTESYRIAIVRSFDGLLSLRIVE